MRKKVWVPAMVSRGTVLTLLTSLRQKNAPWDEEGEEEEE